MAPSPLSRNLIPCSNTIGGKAFPLQICRKTLIWDGIGFDAYAIQEIDDVCSIRGRTELE
jgi:hypothetical protein